jgi:integral membrane sensor domain MASE1
MRRRVEISTTRLGAVVLAAYVALAFSSYELFGALTIGVTFFPPAGLTLATLLLVERRQWPVVACAVVVGEVFVDVVQTGDLWWSFGWAAANLAEPVAGALVIALLGAPIDLDRRFAAHFALGGLVVGPAVGASIGATVLVLANDMPWASSWADIWVGDALGVLVVAPLLLTAIPSLHDVDRDRIGGLLVLGLVAVGVSFVAFFWFDDTPLGYLVIPLLAWAALRSEAFGLAFASASVAVFSTMATARGRGPWSSGSGVDAQDQLGRQQFFLLLAIGGAWILAIESARRTAAVQQTVVAENELERALQRSAQRTHLAATNDLLAQLAAAATPADVVAAASRSGRRLTGADAVVLALVRDGSLDGDEYAGELVVVLRDGHADGAPAGTDDADPVRDVLQHCVLSATEASGSETAADGRVHWWLAAPLRSSTRVIGAAWFARATPWSDTARLRVLSFMSFLADAMTRIEASQRDRRVALTLQRALMPRPLLNGHGALVAGAYRPASSALTVGGDWYQVTERPDGRMHLIVGDVVGHGLTAAAAMGQLASAARALSLTIDSPAELVAALDEVAEETPDAQMATLAVAVFDVRSGELRYCSAGHPPSIVRSPGGEVAFLRGGHGPPLACARRRRTEDRIVLEDGALLLMYTDGLVDWRGTSIDERFDDLAGVVHAIGETNPPDVVREVVAGALGDAWQSDDVAVLCLRVDGESAATAPR